MAAEGDRCARNPPIDYACAIDGSKALVCKDGRFALWRECRGPNACRVVGGRSIKCDTTLGEPEDPCGQKGAYACAADHQTLLLCDGDRLSPASSCHGPEGCRIDPDGQKADCDDTIANEGDPCNQVKRLTCAADGKAELVCTEGHYVKRRDCTRSDCRLEGSALFCE